MDPVHLVSVDLYAFAQSTAQRLSHSTHTLLCKQSGTVLEGIDLVHERPSITTAGGSAWPSDLTYSLTMAPELTPQHPSYDRHTGVPLIP